LPTRAFTLIEVMIVVLLMGLIAGATAWSLAETARHKTRENAVGLIAQADHMARTIARRMPQPCALRFDLDQQHIVRVQARRGGPTQSHRVSLGASQRFDRLVRVAPPGARQQRAGVQWLEAGAAEIAYSTRGRSESFALRLAGPDDREPSWLIVCGLTGQVTFDHDHEDVQETFALLASGRADAD
jgi:prepilin-type N-terminal cleavage/methylation domain-containing protein